MRLSLSLTLALIGTSLPSVAQTHFCIGGDLDHLTRTEVSACQAKMTHVREAVRRRGAPSGWHFVVVCDETAWSDLASFSGRASAQLRTADFNTDREMQWTFLRGSHMETASEEAVGTMLAAALNSVPGRRVGPEAGPTSMPNPERVIQLPAQQVADVREPVSDDALGQ